MQTFSIVAEIFVWGGIGSAAAIGMDLINCRQQMKIMNAVWILTGLWASFLGLIAYYAFGRQCNALLTDAEPPEKIKMEMSEAMKMERMTGMGHMEMSHSKRPYWQKVTLSALHCGGGCTLADLIGEWFLYFVPVAICGSHIAGSWVIDYCLALVIGIGFQYAAIRGMQRDLSSGTVLWRATKADVLSLTSWQVGMYGWMAIVIFALNGGQTLPRTSVEFWFMMQIAMGCGFLCAVPMNMLLIKLGIKKGM